MVQQKIVLTLFPRPIPVKPLLIRESGISKFAPRLLQVERHVGMVCRMAWEMI
jgi:hypothetical protein